VVVIEGPPGVGKTRLIASARGIAADQRLASLVARGGRLEREFGFGVARQLFEQQVASLSPTDRARALDGAAALAGPLLGLAAAGGDPHPGSLPDPEFAALHGLYWLSANLAAHTPLVLAIDDAQWADQPSLRYLAYLAHRIDELAVLLVLAVRTGEPDAPNELLGPLATGAARLRPRPLSEAGTGRLVASSLGLPGEPAFVAACHRGSGGNPFLLQALLAALRAREVEPTAEAAVLVGEASIEEVSLAVSTRLGSLSEEARALAEAVAVLGNDVERSTASALAALTDEEAADAADSLAVAEILASTSPLEFVHPLVRAAVYEAIRPARRARAHARAAALLVAAGAEPERVAVQLLSAEPGSVPGGAATLKRAATRGLERGSPGTATGYLSRALREPVSGHERGELLHGLGAIELRQGKPAALEHLSEALELTPPGTRRATVARELSLGLVPSGRYAEAISVLEAAAEELGAEDRELSLQIEAEIGTEAMLSAATLPSAIERLVRRRDEVAAAATPGERAVLATIANLEASGEADADRVSETAALALTGGLLEDQGPDSHVFYNVPFPLIAADRYEEAMGALDAALAESRRRGSLLGVARATVFRAQIAFRRGALADAEVDARASVEASAPTWIVGQMATGWLVEVLVERGELGEAQRELTRAQLDRELDDILMHNFPLVSRARFKLALGDPAGAAADLEELDRREGEGRARNPAWFGHRGLMAEALIRLGEPQAAAGIAAEEVELARRWGAPRAIGVALRALGLAASAEARLVRLREAAEVLAGSGAQLEHARALVDLGAELRRQGSRRECREPLHRGMEIAHRCGATPLAERARTELVASGARPRRMVRTGIAALTPSELRVARMAAEGMTNREIAQALFVTLRTVEVHLTHTYQKLDVSSREALPGALTNGADDDRAIIGT
jgi:DNA-binding CsgD family transcriptional regulator